MPDLADQIHAGYMDIKAQARETEYFLYTAPDSPLHTFTARSVAERDRIIKAFLGLPDSADLVLAKWAVAHYNAAGVPQFAGPLRDEFRERLPHRR